MVHSSWSWRRRAYLERSKVVGSSWLFSSSLVLDENHSFFFFFFLSFPSHPRFWCPQNKQHTWICLTKLSLSTLGRPCLTFFPLNAFHKLLQLILIISAFIVISKWINNTFLLLYIWKCSNNYTLILN